MQVGQQLGASLEHVDQRDLTVGAHQRNPRIDLCHREPAARRGDRVTLAGAGLLAGQQRIEFGLPCCPVDDTGQPAGRVWNWHSHLLVWSAPHEAASQDGPGRGAQLIGREQ